MALGDPISAGNVPLNEHSDSEKFCRVVRVDKNEGSVPPSRGFVSSQQVSEDKNGNMALDHEVRSGKDNSVGLTNCLHVGHKVEISFQGATSKQQRFQRRKKSKFGRNGRGVQVEFNGNVL